MSANNIAITGLNAIGQKLDSISHNIANADTVGFKSGRTEFKSLYAGGQPLGVGVANVTESIGKSGSVISTGNSLDLAISGNGFFMMRDTAGNIAYTRAGYFNVSEKDGKLINNLGMNLQGYSADASGAIQTGVVGDITISKGSIPAKATSKIAFSANLNAGATNPKVTPFSPKNSDSFNNTYSSQVYDSLGREHTLSQYFVKTGENAWEVHYYLDNNKVTTPAAAQKLTFTNQGVMSSPTAAVAIKASVAGADDIAVDVDYQGTTQFGSEFAVSNNQGDGYTSGRCTGQSIADDGSIYATYSNGERKLQGQLVLANFANADSLTSQEGTLWVQKGNATPLLGTAGSGLFGSIKAGALESSNVDITAEMVGLMSAQRNYQANTKVLSTDNNMTTALLQAI